MKNLIFLFAIVALLSCKKEDPDKQARVTYKVIETSAAAPSYSVSYSSDNNSTRTEGPITSEAWNSPVVEKERGDFLSFTLESANGTGSFTMRIYMNGVLWQERTADNPSSPITLSGNLPE
jgi:hypothetical protein